MRLAENTSDSFYFIDLKTGATSMIAGTEETYDVSQISISADEKYIYFTDKSVNGLHQIKID